MGEQEYFQQVWEKFQNSPDQLSFEELRFLRDRAGLQYQQPLARLEHQKFASQFTQENPLASLGLLLGIPGYQAAKGLGLMQSRTGTSDPWGQIKSGYKGLGEGWLNVLGRTNPNMGGKPVPVPPSYPMPTQVPPRQPWVSPIGTPEEARKYLDGIRR